LELKDISYNLFEADNLWGGRLRSFQSTTFTRDPTAAPDPVNNPHLWLEEAAQFMYGTNDPSENRENPIARLFRNFDVETFIYDSSDWDTYDRNGNPDAYTDAEVQGLRDEMIKSVEKCLDKKGEAWFRQFLQGKVRPDESAESMLRNCKGRFSWPVGDDATDLEAAMSHFYVEVENAAPLSAFGKASFPESSFFTFSSHSFTQFDQDGGTSQMIQELVDANLDSSSIFLQHKVTKVIQQSPSGLYKITVEDLSTPDPNDCLEFESEYVIVTAPINILLGYEDNNQIEFSPPLEINNHPIRQVKVHLSSLSLSLLRLWFTLLETQFSFSPLSLSCCCCCCVTNYL